MRRSVRLYLTALAVIAFAVAGAVLGTWIQRALRWPYWTYHVIVVGLGLALYFVHSILMTGFIRKRAPEFLSKEEVRPEVEKSELTAGTGVVPKWASVVGLAAVGFVLSSPFELVAMALRAIGLT
jgi:hypothetical protein